MVRINGNNPNTNHQWKAQAVENETNLDQLDARLDEALAQIEEFELNYHEYLNDDQMVQLKALKVTLRAQSAAIDAFKAGVDGSGPLGNSETGYDFESQTSLEDLGNGWSENANITQRPEHASAMDPNLDGEYVGSVIVDNLGGNTVNPLGFSITDAFEADLDMTIDQLMVRSQGKDLVFTVIGRDSNGDEKRCSWVVVNGSVNSIPIIINANELSHGINIDCSRAYRIADGNWNSQPGIARGFYIWGTEFEDTIQGSQAADKIAALGDNDFVDAHAGDDIVYGDYVEDQNAPSPGGDDTIRGGVGVDQLYGGGSSEYGDTRYDSDTTSTANPGVTHGFENIANDVSATVPDPNSWITKDGWDFTYGSDGTLILQQTDPSIGGIINFDMENMPGDVEYTMVFAELASNGTDAILNFVGYAPDGSPQTFKIRIENFMTSIVGDDPKKIIHLNLRCSNVDNIADFSALTGLTSQVINIEGMAGDDILIGAESEVLAQGIPYDSLISSSETGQVISGYVTDGMFFDQEATNGRTDTYNGYTATYVSASGEIVLNPPDPNEHDPTQGVQIVAPEGYEQAYIAVDPHATNPAEPDLLVIMYNPSTGKTMVIRITWELIDQYQLTYDKIMISNISDSDFDENTGYNHIFGNAWGLMPISLDPADYMISGGDGNDIAYGLKGTKFGSDVEHQVEEDPEMMGLNEVENSGGQTP